MKIRTFVKIDIYSFSMTAGLTELSLIEGSGHLIYFKALTGSALLCFNYRFTRDHHHQLFEFLPGLHPVQIHHHLYIYSTLACHWSISSQKVAKASAVGLQNVYYLHISHILHKVNIILWTNQTNLKHSSNLSFICYDTSCNISWIEYGVRIFIILDIWLLVIFLQSN